MTIPFFTALQKIGLFKEVIPLGQAKVAFMGCDWVADLWEGENQFMANRSRTSSIHGFVLADEGLLRWPAQAPIQTAANSLLPLIKQIGYIGTI